MKKSLFLIGALLMGTSVYSQIFSENFDAATSLPAGWTEYNVDGLTPATNMSFMGASAWVVRTSADAGHGKVMTSTSWYTPTGTSNDWLVTPAIAIPATGDFAFEYDVKAQDASFPDGYQVYISTTGNTVADFTAPAVFQTSAAAPAWTEKSINLAAYLGQTIYVAFRNNSTDKFLLYIDNVVVRELPALDAKVNSVTLTRYAAVNTNNTLKVSVANRGLQPITTLEINWNDGADHIATINTNIAPGATANVTHPSSVNYSTAVEKPITVTILNVNGVADADLTNNAGDTKINTLSEFPTKNVVVEEGTGTWCVWCPRGAVAMDYMYTNYPTRFIGIAVHNGDPMALAAYDNAADFDGYPSSNVDRAILGGDVSVSDFETYYNARKDIIAPAAIDGTVSVSGSNVTIVADATFKTPMTNANYRLAVVIAENNVTGTSSGYNQKNAYAGGGSGPMGGYESLPNPVPAAQMVYNHVGRALLGGYNGQAGSIPAAIANGSVNSYTFNYTVPSTSNRMNMNAVIMLIDQTNGEIVNAKSVPLSTLGVNDNVATINLNVYPNPSSDIVKVDFEAAGNDYSITIYDLQGKVVKTQNHNNLTGLQSIEVGVSDLSSGSYLITVATEGASFTQQMIVK